MSTSVPLTLHLANGASTYVVLAAPTDDFHTVALKLQQMINATGGLAAGKEPKPLDAGEEGEIDIPKPSFDTNSDDDDDEKESDAEIGNETTDTEPEGNGNGTYATGRQVDASQLKFAIWSANNNGRSKELTQPVDDKSKLLQDFKIREHAVIAFALEDDDGEFYVSQPTADE